jgi:hypothetical protein
MMIFLEAAALHDTFSCSLTPAAIADSIHRWKFVGNHERIPLEQLQRQFLG